MDFSDGSSSLLFSDDFFLLPTVDVDLIALALNLYGVETLGELRTFTPPRSAEEMIDGASMEGKVIDDALSDSIFRYFSSLCNGLSSASNSGMLT